MCVQKWDPGFLPLYAQQPGLGLWFPKSGLGPGSEVSSVPRGRFRDPTNLGNAVHSTPVWAHGACWQTEGSEKS